MILTCIAWDGTETITRWMASADGRPDHYYRRQDTLRGWRRGQRKHRDDIWISAVTKPEGGHNKQLCAPHKLAYPSDVELKSSKAFPKLVALIKLGFPRYLRERRICRAWCRKET